MTKIEPTSELDCRGLFCPVPVIRTRKAIGALASGEVLRVVATDPNSVIDMAAFSWRTGHEILEQEEDDGEFAFLLRKA